MGIIKSVEAAAWQNDIPENQRDLYDGTTYVCSNCTHDEKHSLWWLWSEHYRVPWHERGMGSALTIGGMIGGNNDRPIAVTVFWAEIGVGSNAHSVAFVDVTSSLADHSMRERWETAVFKNVLQHSDVANFGHIIGDIEERYRTQLFDRRRIRAIDQVLEVDSANLTTLGDLETDPHKAFVRCEQKMLEWGERAKYYQGLMRQDGQDAKGSRKAR